MNPWTSMIQGLCSPACQRCYTTSTNVSVMDSQDIQRSKYGTWFDFGSECLCLHQVNCLCCSDAGGPEMFM